MVCDSKLNVDPPVKFPLSDAECSFDRYADEHLPAEPEDLLRDTTRNLREEDYLNLRKTIVKDNFWKIKVS